MPWTAGDRRGWQCRCCKPVKPPGVEQPRFLQPPQGEQQTKVTVRHAMSWLCLQSNVADVANRHTVLGCRVVHNLIGAPCRWARRSRLSCSSSPHRHPWCTSPTSIPTRMVRIKCTVRTSSAHGAAHATLRCATRQVPAHLLRKTCPVMGVVEAALTLCRRAVVD